MKVPLIGKRALSFAALMLTVWCPGVVSAGAQANTFANGNGVAGATVIAFLTLNRVDARDPPVGFVNLPSVAIPADPMRAANVEVGLPAGADPGTFARAWGGVGGRRIVRVTLKAGDVGCGSVVASSPSASGVIDVEGVQLSETTLELTVNWSGTDPGIAGCFSVSDQGGSGTLVNETRTGSWNESVTFTVTAQSSVEDLFISAELVGESLPSYGPQHDIESAKGVGLPRDLVCLNQAVPSSDLSSPRFVADAVESRTALALPAGDAILSPSLRRNPLCSRQFWSERPAKHINT
jgi:hypothetical protein